MGARACRYAGFSLVEVVVSAVILSGAVLAICGISTRSFAGVRLNRDYEHAWDLLDRQLALIDYTGIDQFLEADEMAGVFEEEYGGEAVHYWQATVMEAEPAGLYIVEVGVSWRDGAQQRMVSARTMLNSTRVRETESREGAPGGAGGEGQEASSRGEGGQSGNREVDQRAGGGPTGGEAVSGGGRRPSGGATRRGGNRSGGAGTQRSGGRSTGGTRR